MLKSGTGTKEAGAVLSVVNTLSMEFATPGTTGEAWRDCLTKAYYALDVVLPEGEAPRGSLSEARFPSIGVSHVQTNVRKVIRSRDAVKNDKTEDFVFLLPQRGPLTYRQRAGHTTAAVGDAIILNSAECYEVSSPRWTDHVAIKIPCDLLRDRLRWIDDCCASPGQTDTALVPIVSSFALQLMSINDPTTAHRLEAVCLDLITVMLDAQHRGLDGAAQSMWTNEILHSQLRDFMRKNFSDPNITISDAARACRISKRSMQRFLQSQNTTFARELLELRLQNADRLLRTQRALQIGRTAELCGFPNQAHFAACYRRRFGATPRETRTLSIVQT